jgi:hypothetical protein
LVLQEALVEHFRSSRLMQRRDNYCPFVLN